MNQGQLETLTRVIRRFIGDLRVFHDSHKGDLTVNGNKKLQGILEHMTLLQERLEACLRPGGMDCKELGSPIEWSRLQSQIANTRREMNNTEPSVRGLASLGE